LREAVGSESDAAAVETAAVFMKSLRENMSVSFLGTGLAIAQHTGTHSLPNWPHPFSGNHLAGLGRLVEACASLLMHFSRFEFFALRARLGRAPCNCPVVQADAEGLSVAQGLPASATRTDWREPARMLRVAVLMQSLL
jgi:hypothetical protein